VIATVAPRLQQSGVQILHAVGPKNELPQSDNMPGMPPYRPVPYVDRMDLAYAAADMMLCRAGAMTVAELSAVGLPADLTPDWVLANVLPVLTDPHRLYDMSRAAAEFGRRDADDLLVAMVYEAVASRGR
jgi:UDP-N-acetylglucosamine--N-acetylmuramyl-(pentapeptide) pyrophosphoryl-undecaprenol N-acetylglucosamine transferase